MTALNMRLRDDYVKDCTRGVERWNKIIDNSGVDFRFRLPHLAFHRQIGEFADIQATPAGEIITDVEWQRRTHEFLPSTEDGEFIATLMIPVREPGAFASWIAPPKFGIDNKPGDFQYVRRRPEGFRLPPRSGAGSILSRRRCWVGRYRSRADRLHVQYSCLGPACHRSLVQGVRRCRLVRAKHRPRSWHAVRQPRVHVSRADNAAP